MAEEIESLVENSAAEVSAVLAFLREVQRAHDVAVLVAHHARKNAHAPALARACV